MKSLIFFLILLLTVGSTGFVSGQDREARSGFTGWAVRNPEGFNQAPVVVPRDGRLIGMEVREQAGYGLVNLRLVYFQNGRIEKTNWATSNKNGEIRAASLAKNSNRGSANFVMGVSVKQQAGYGLVNMKLLGESTNSGWVTKNHPKQQPPPVGTIAVSWNDRDQAPQIKVKAGWEIYGFQVREQAGYGLIDIRAAVRRRG